MWRENALMDDVEGMSCMSDFGDLKARSEGMEQLIALLKEFRQNLMDALAR